MPLLARVLVGLAIVAAVVWRVLDVTTTEAYSREWHRASSAEAAARGQLGARPAIPVTAVQFQGRTVHVVDAWVEQVTHVTYAAFLVEHEEREPLYRLVLRTTTDAGAADYTCDARLVWGDSATLRTDGDYLIGERLVPPFPDSVAVRVVRRPQC
jgi:hypothetical protein